MLTSIFIIAISLVLFVYWFRYSCVLLLRNAREREARLGGRPDERFGVAAVVQRLERRSGPRPPGAVPRTRLPRISYLIGHAADLELASIETKLLVLRLQDDARVVSRHAHAGARGTRATLCAKWPPCWQVLVAQLGEQRGRAGASLTRLRCRIPSIL